MTKMTNFIQFDADDLDTAKGAGLISTLDRDLEVTVVPFTSENPKAPTHRVLGKSPRGFDVEVGGIWKKKNREGGTYYNISIPPMEFNGNLGRLAGQDDERLQAVIPWGPAPKD